MARKSHSEIALLVETLDQAYDKSAWHGPNLRGSIRGLRATQAIWRPGAKRRNIAEITVHCAYWKYAVRRRLTGEKRGSFPLKGSNWFKLPVKLSDVEWKSYGALIDEQHAALRQAITVLSAGKLHSKSAASKHTNAFLIEGIALHDVYHAGQVRTLKSLFKQR